MRAFSMVLREKMTSYDTDDVIPGKIRYLTRTTKSGVNIIGFLSKFQNIFILVKSLLYSFWRKSQLIKYSKWRTEICKICIFERNFGILLRFQNKIYFCNQHDRLIPKIYFLCVLVSTSGFKKSTSGSN